MKRPRLALSRPLIDGAPRTIITRTDGGFRVATDPPQPGYAEPETFATYREARGYAGGIRLSRAIPIDDQTDEADRG